jgi:hypothetical protein
MEHGDFTVCLNPAITSLYTLLGNPGNEEKESDGEKRPLAMIRFDFYIIDTR